MDALTNTPRRTYDGRAELDAERCSTLVLTMA
jgi:hypothetical protein